MTARRILLYGALAVVGLVLLNLMFDSIQVIRGDSGVIRVDNVYSLSIPVLYSVLFGILIEWEKAWSVLKGQVRAGWYLCPVVMLLLIILIPHNLWVIYFGGLVSGPLAWFVNPLYATETNMVLGVLSGILLIRVLVKPKAEDS